MAPHRIAGYRIVTASLKPAGAPPGDASAVQMEGVADIADAYSQGEIRVSHEQNLILPHVARRGSAGCMARARTAGLAEANVGKITDIIACPGLDYCALANARSIPVAQRISERFAELARQHEIGDLKIKISGCINACGHHHVGHIGILGVDKNGVELYQLSLGGDVDFGKTAIGTILGPAVTADKVVEAVDAMVAPISTIAVTASASSTPIGASAPSPSRSEFMPLFSEKGSATILEPLPFADWQQRPAWPAVSLANTDPVEDLAPHVGRLRLIVLNFPKFSDGRAYSQARLLRGRLGYAGELRATGGVLQDQLPFMLRCGFDLRKRPEGLWRGFGQGPHAFQRGLPARRGRPGARFATATEQAQRGDDRLVSNNL